MSDEVDLRLKIGADPDTRIFRFQCGRFQLKDDRYITVGVPGMPDFLGWHSVVITPEWIGRRVAVFAAIETKKVNSRTTRKRLLSQGGFLTTVRQFGGYAGFAYSVAQAREILNRPPGMIELEDE